MDYEYPDPTEYSPCEKCGKETPDYDFHHVIFDDGWFGEEWLYVCSKCKIEYKHLTLEVL